jgi:sulfate transport system ATP-binding protein
MSIAVRHVSKRFGTFTALDDATLDVPSGELVALIGPSGSGKTTLLRIIAGLEVPDAGTILFDDEDATAQHVAIRRVGFVFQHYALFRHMTVSENIAFGLRVRPRRLRPAERDIQTRVRELLNLVQLDWVADRYPSQLSGGQRQRIALARALAIGSCGRASSVHEDAHGAGPHVYLIPDRELQLAIPLLAHLGLDEPAAVGALEVEPHA